MDSRNTLHGIFEHTASGNPDALALKYGSQRISFAELNARAEAIAAAVIQHQTAAAPDAPPIVALLLPRSIEAVAGILGTLKAGCTWLVLDPAYPEDRLRFMLNDSKAFMVLSLQCVGEKLRCHTENSVPILLLDEYFEPEHSNALSASRTVGPRSPAYLIYTSGSTGEPRGVLGSHAAILSRFEWMWESFPFLADEVVCNKTALSFVDSIWEIFGALLKGVPCVIADEATARDPTRLLHLLHDENVSRLVAVPSLISALLDAASNNGVRLDRLRFLTSSGEPLSSRLAARVDHLGPSVTLLNLYGSSEMAADATCCVVTPDLLDRRNAPIGKPIGAMRIFVLDEALRPVAEGASGELYVSGPGLAIGYLGCPELTAEKFIDNPFAVDGDIDHTRLFRSGDLVALRADGNLDYVGRTDFQIKLRGFRIEPGEIETCLMLHPDIHACAVCLVEDKDLRQLTAFYVSSAEPRPAASALREFLLERLPEHVVPSSFIRLEELPLLPNGKLDRRALATLKGDRTDAIAITRENLLEAEAEMLRLWQLLLRQSLIGLDDDFFAVGGDSLLAFKVATAARGKGWSLVPADIYEHRTIRKLATLRTTQPTASEPQQEISIGRSVLLSPMQQYYFTWARPNPNKFNVGFIAALREIPQQRPLIDALHALVEHHDALRLRFQTAPDQPPRQHHTSHEVAGEIPIARVVLPQGDQAAKLEAMRAEIPRLHDALDITNGPVMTLALFEDPDGAHHHLFFTMHELVSDAWSLQIFLEDLRTSYLAGIEGREVALPEKTTPYHVWVEKVRDYARLPDTAKQLDYWLAGQKAAPFPEDFQDRDALQSDISCHSFEVLDEKQMNSVRAGFGAATQTIMIHAIVGALAVAANRISGQSDLIFHKVAHGRETVIRNTDPSRTIGWFITHTPITVRLPHSGSGDLRSVLRHVGNQYQQIPDNGIGHSALRYFSDDPRAVALAEQDQVRTLFQYIGDIWQENYDNDLFLPPSAELMDLPDTVAAENCADYHLHVYAYLMDGAFRIKFFYTRPNYRRETILRMEQLFTEAVRGMLLDEEPEHDRHQ